MDKITDQEVKWACLCDSAYSTLFKLLQCSKRIKNSGKKIVYGMCNDKRCTLRSRN